MWVTMIEKEVPLKKGAVDGDSATLVGASQMLLTNIKV
jgi:hypothetical protein